MPKEQFFRLCTTALISVFCVCVSADYVPDVVEFKGDDGLGFPTHESLTLTDGGTIEFWVGADWSEDPQYDPVVLSNAGPEGALYTVAILGSRQGLSLQAGGFAGAVPFDFSDGDMHHVALADFTDEVIVMVDGVVAGSFDTTLRALPSSGFWVGSADGVNATFRGAVAGIRIWSVALERQSLVDYAMLDVNDLNLPHPDLDMLVAVSRFGEASLLLTALDVGEEIEGEGR